MQIFRIIRRIYVIVFKNYVYEKVEMDWFTSIGHQPSVTNNQKTSRGQQTVFTIEKC